MDKKKIMNVDVFILNNDNLDNYNLVDPNELIIIYSSNYYSEIFLHSIINGGTKFNVRKIITSDSVIVKYLQRINSSFQKLFPNCKTIQINSFQNNFLLISRIIDNTQIIQNIEYILNDYIFINYSGFKYNFFTESLFTGGLSNIKYIKIINNITFESECSIDKKINKNIINLDIIEKNNKNQFDKMIKQNIDNKYVNNIYFEYIDKKNNIYFNSCVMNIN